MTGKWNIGPPMVRAGHSMYDMVAVIRPLNAVLMAAGVVLGGFLYAGSGAFAPGFSLLKAAIAAALVGAGANAMNDALDAGTDAVNRPDRPVASGRMTPASALMIGIALMLGGLVLAWTDTPGRGMLASLAVLLLIAYNVRLSRMPVVGNVVVALIVGVSLGFGAAGEPGAGSMASPSPTALLCGVYFAFMMTWVREIVKDMEDVEGDRLQGYRTLPIVRGMRSARRLAVALLGIVIASGPLPYLVFSFSGLYLMNMLVTLSVVILVLVRLSSEHLDASSVSRSLKWAMLLGMISLATFDQGVG